MRFATLSVAFGSGVPLDSSLPSLPQPARTSTTSSASAVFTGDMSGLEFDDGRLSVRCRSPGACQALGVGDGRGSLSPTSLVTCLGSTGQTGPGLNRFVGLGLVVEPRDIANPFRVQIGRATGREREVKE